MMGVRVCVAVLVVAAALVTLPQQGNAQPFKLGSFLTSLGGSIVDKVWVDREITLLDHYCTMSRQPYIRRLELHHRAQVSCPGWTTILGKGDGHTNPSNSENDAIKDFMRKAIAANLVTKEEAAPWLN